MNVLNMFTIMLLNYITIKKKYNILYDIICLMDKYIIIKLENQLKRSLKLFYPST